MELKERKLESGGTTYVASILDLENAVLVLFHDGTNRIGTLAFAMPGTGHMRASTSSVLLGGRYMVCSRALAERVAAKSGKMSLVSVATSLEENEALRTFIKLIDNEEQEKRDRSAG